MSNWQEEAGEKVKASQKKKQEKVSLDQVVLIDQEDNILGAMDKIEAHRGEGKLHQAISFFLFSFDSQKNWQLFLQKRSSTKIVGANLWANTVCANLRPGETHRSCLKRRLLEELGLREDSFSELAVGPILRYQAACEPGWSENEIDHFFFAYLLPEQVQAFSIQANPQEVAETTWVSWREIKEFGNNQKKSENDFTPWFQYFIQNKQIVKSIDNYLDRLERKFFINKNEKVESFL